MFRVLYEENNLFIGNILQGNKLTWGEKKIQTLIMAAQTTSFLRRQRVLFIPHSGTMGRSPVSPFFQSKDVKWSAEVDGSCPAEIAKSKLYKYPQDQCSTPNETKQKRKKSLLCAAKKSCDFFLLLLRHKNGLRQTTRDLSWFFGGFCFCWGCFFVFWGTTCRWLLTALLRQVWNWRDVAIQS